MEQGKSFDVLQEFNEACREVAAPGEPFAISRVVVRGQEVRIFENGPSDLNAFFGKVLSEHRSRDLLEYEGRRYTYGQVFDDAARLGAALRRGHGIKTGDRVGIAMRNLPEWFVAFVAITQIGAVATLLNSRGAPAEIAAAAQSVGCDLVMCDERCGQRLREAEFAGMILSLSDVLAMAQVESSDPGAVEVDADAPAAIIFTSGTTGRAKGATLTHRNICTVPFHAAYAAEVGMVLAARRSGMSVATLRADVPPDSRLLVFPLFHISGVVTFLLAARCGGLITMLRRWDPATAIALIEKNRVTGMSGPSMVMADLLDQPNAAARMASMRSLIVGGQATPIALAQRISQTLPNAAQSGSWGMTEITGAAATASGAIFKAYPGSSGLLSPLFDGKVMRPDGEEASPGEIGELCVRGSPVMAGYWNDPEANAASFVDGWFKSGDLGYIDEQGLLYIVDRQKDIVLSASENIYCAEVEMVMGRLPELLEVALFGVPDMRLGERAIAAVVLQPEAELDEAHVKAAVGASLADYKVPKEVRFDLGPLPRNALGKVDKVALRERYLERTLVT